MKRDFTEEMMERRKKISQSAPRPSEVLIIRKVHASEQNAHAALQNIEHKIAIVEDWIRNGVPIKEGDGEHKKTDLGTAVVLDFYPQTLRQFNLWDGTKNCEAVRIRLGVIRCNAPQTLRKSERLQKTVVELLAALRSRADEQIRSKQPQRVSKLKQELFLAESRAKRLEMEFVEQRLKLKQLESSVAQLEAKNELISTESHKAIRALSETVDALRAENGDLIRQLLKVTPLRAMEKKG